MSIPRQIKSKGRKNVSFRSGEEQRDDKITSPPKTGFLWRAEKPQRSYRGGKKKAKNWKGKSPAAKRVQLTNEIITYDTSFFIGGFFTGP